MYNYGVTIDIPVYDDDKIKEEKDDKTQLQTQDEKVNTQHHQDSFCMLTNLMADKFANVDDKMDMFQKAQAGTRQQVSELHSMLNELLFRERSQI